MDIDLGRGEESIQPYLHHHAALNSPGNNSGNDIAFLVLGDNSLPVLQLIRFLLGDTDHAFFILQPFQ